MSNYLDIGLVFYEGPISRAYVNYFKKKNIKLISNHFNLDDDFITDKYSNFDLKTIADRIFYISDDNINSEKLFDKLKKFFDIGHDLIHIHPGYLSNIKGADGVLWSTLKYNYLGVSSFLIKFYH
jgi:hypothetical protein